MNVITASKTVERGQVIGSIEAAKMVDDLVIPLAVKLLLLMKMSSAIQD